MTPFDDRGLTLGDGLFETVLARNGQLAGTEAHLDRLALGCEAIGLPPPDRAKARSVMRQALTGAGLEHSRAAVRLTLTAGSGGRGLERPSSPEPRMFATAAAAPMPPGPARLAVSLVRRNAASPGSRLKTLSYIDNVLARREAQAAGCDEALMLNGEGEVACATAANVFWIAEGRLFTPALECGVLAGTMRARVLDAAGRLGVTTVQVRAGLADLEAGEAAFLTNALIGVRPVASLGERTYGRATLVDELARVAVG